MCVCVRVCVNVGARPDKVRWAGRLAYTLGKSREADAPFPRINTRDRKTSSLTGMQPTDAVGIKMRKISDSQSVQTAPEVGSKPKVVTPQAFPEWARGVPSNMLAKLLARIACVQVASL